MDGTLTRWIESARSSDNRRRRTIQRRLDRITHAAGAQGKAPGVDARYCVSSLMTSEHERFGSVECAARQLKMSSTHRSTK